MSWSTDLEHVIEVNVSGGRGHVLMPLRIGPPPFFPIIDPRQRNKKIWRRARMARKRRRGYA